MFHSLTSRLIMIAGLFAALVLAGCGGSGDSGVENTLRADLDALEGELEDLQDDLKDATDRASAAEQARRAAEERERQARGDAADDIADAQQARDEAQRQTQTLEANQRALNLLKTFPNLSVTSPPNAADQLSTRTRDPMVSPTVPRKNQLVFAKPTYNVGSQSAPAGLRAAKLTRTRGGADTIVVYTDRELSRPLLEHYADFKSETAAVQFRIDESGLPDEIEVNSDANFVTSAELVVGHGFTNAKAADDDVTMKTKMAASFSGSVHGVSGQFRCGGTADCMLTLTATYSADEAGVVTATENKLTDVEMSASNSANIFFRPSSPLAPIYLGDAGVQGVTTDDEEYITFGWWRTEPSTALGAYGFGVFATGMDLETAGNFPNGVSGTAEYDGTAVGMYVEQGGLGGTGVASRQGEFVAAARLNANFTTSNLSGTIDSFTTTPTGGSAVPTTSDSWAVDLIDDGGVKIDIRGTTSDGSWSHQFVENHEHAPDDAQPPAVVGSFNASIENLLHLVGAFGAHK